MSCFKLETLLIKKKDAFPDLNFMQMYICTEISHSAP